MDSLTVGRECQRVVYRVLYPEPGYRVEKVIAYSVGMHALYGVFETKMIWLLLEGAKLQQDKTTHHHLDFLRRRHLTGSEMAQFWSENVAALAALAAPHRIRPRPVIC